MWIVGLHVCRRLDGRARTHRGGISNAAIERAYHVAESHGMVAGKVSGAGGGGFLMMIVDPRRGVEVTRSLERECGGSVSPFLFTNDGAATWRMPARKKAASRPVPGMR